MFYWESIDLIQVVGSGNIDTEKNILQYSLYVLAQKLSDPHVIYFQAFL